MTRTIRGKMILFIGLPAAAIFVTAVLWILSGAEKQVRQMREAEMAEKTVTAAARFDEYIGKAARIADTTARFVSYVPNLGDGQIYGMLAGTVRLNRRVYGAAMAFEPGTYKEGDELFSPYVYEKRDGKGIEKMNIDRSVYDWYGDEQWQWWHLPKELRKGIWTDPYFDEGAGNVLMVTYSAPFNRKSEFGGVTTVDIDLERLQDDIEETIPGIGDFYVLGPDGQIIFSPDAEEILSATVFEMLEQKGKAEMGESIRSMLGGDSGEMTIEGGAFGEERMMVAYAPIPSPGWTFISFQPEADAMADFHKRRIYVIGGFTLAGALMLVTIFFMSGKVARPIRQLRGQVLRIADGESDASIDEIRTGDEIAELAGAFGTMQKKVADREAKLEIARETTLTELLESAPDAMIVADSEGRICRMNSKMSDIFGYEQDELQGMSAEDLMPEPFRAGHGAHMKGYFANPNARQMGSGLELAGLRKDGTEFPIEIGLSPFHEPGGTRAVAAIRDITERKQAEADLRKLNQAIEQGSAMVFITDADGDIEYVNPRFTEVTGYTAAEAIGQNPRLLKSGLHDPDFYEELWGTLSSGEEWRGEFRNRRKNGELFWASAALAPIRDPDGEITHFVAIEDDVTAEKEAAEEIQQKEERFRTLLANLPGTVYRCAHDEHWTMLFISDRVEELTGYPAPDFLNNSVRTFDSVIHPDDRAMVAKEVGAAVNEKAPWIIEYRVVRADGSLRWAGERGRAVFREDGEVDYLDGVIADVTENKRIEEELHTTNFLSDIALELAHCGYWHVDYSDPDYYYQSERAARMLGEPMKPDGRYHLQDEWFARLVEANPETAELTAERYQGAIDGRYENYDSTYAYKRPIDGATIWLHALGKIVRDDNDRIQYMYGVYQDVTQRIANEKALQEATHAAEAATRAKSDFLSSMSHELRTPLNGVLGYAQILQRDKEATPRQKENVESIINCGDHLLSLINDVLDLSKIEAGRIDLDEGPTDLEKLIRSLTDIIGERARSKDLEFKVDVSPEVPRGIVTDGPKLRQVLVNLLGNAVKFTDEGSVTLRVAEIADEQLAFEVIDTGVGMDAHELEEIFDPFKQVEAGKAAGGTGLGLSISRKLMEKMGGRLEVESEKGKGSCFRICLPLREYDHGDLGTLDTDEAADFSDAVLAPGQSVHILVTDDREANRDILEQMLEETGFEVTLADDGDTALELMAKHDFDLVLMDVRMPRLNGIEAVKLIREDEKLRKTPVIAVTASVFPEFREKAKAAGFDDFLPKPFRASELMRILTHFLEVEWETGKGGEKGETSPESPGGAGSEPAELKLTGPSLEKFQAALKIKNLTALNALARDLENDPETAAAGSEIARLAGSFDFAGLADLEKQLGGDETDDE